MRCSGPAVSRTSWRASLSMCTYTVSGQWTVLGSGPCVDCLIFQSPPDGQALLKMNPTSQIFTQVLLKSAWSVYSNGSRKIWRDQLLGQHLIMLLSCVLITLSTIVYPHSHHLLPLDQWPGGYIFLYWAVDEGPKWLRDMIKEGIQVCSFLKRYYTGFLLSSRCLFFSFCSLSWRVKIPYNIFYAQFYFV